MNTLSTRLTLDGSDFSQSLNEASKSVEDFKKSTSDASKSVDDMGKSSQRTASELLKEMKNMEGLGRTTSNYRQQLSQMTRQIQDLSLNYSKMSDEMKNSDFGREVASQIDELKSKAAEYKDTLMDVQTSITKLSSDTSNLDALKMGFEGVGAAMSLVASAGILGADSQEKLIKVMARLQTIQAATNSVIQIANVLNKDSLLMLKLKEFWTKKVTAATNASTTATKKFALALKATPYGIVIAAIAALIAAYVKWSEKTREQLAFQTKLGTKLKLTEEQMKRFGDAVGSAVGKAVYTFDQLADKFSVLDTFREKQQFLRDYAQEMENLGIKAKNVNDLEDIFINKKDSFRDAIIVRAQYVALQGLLEEEYTKAFKKAASASSQNLHQRGERITRAKQYFDINGLVEGEDYTVIVNDMVNGITAELTNKGAQKLNRAFSGVFNDAAREAANKAGQPLLDMMKSLEEQYGLGGLGSTSGSGGSGSTSSSYEKGSVADYNAQIEKLNQRLKNEKLTYEEIQSILEQIVVLEGQRTLAENGGLLPTIKPIQPDQIKSSTESELKVPVTAQVEKITWLEGVDGMISGVNSINSGLQSMYKTWRDIGDTISNCEDPIESMFTVIGMIGQTLSTITGIMQTVNTLESIAVGLKQEEATAAGVAAAGEAATSASKIPYVGWAIAIGAIAAIIGALATAKSSVHFAQGGIVPGSSYSGDNILAGLNSGELVLNKSQQGRLFNILDGKAAFGGGKVEFVIKGQELKGVLNNYDKKMSRL